MWLRIPSSIYGNLKTIHHTNPESDQIAHWRRKATTASAILRGIKKFMIGLQNIVLHPHPIIHIYYNDPYNPNLKHVEMFVYFVFETHVYKV